MQASPINYAEKLDPGERQERPINLVANIRGIIPRRNIPIYRYDIRILEEFPPNASQIPTKEITKQTEEECPSIERKNKCVEIFTIVVDRERNFFGKRDGLVYDRASILYTMDQLAIRESEEKTFEILPRELREGVVSAECTRVTFSVKRCIEDFQLTTNDLKQAADANERNRSLLQFFELLLSQQAFFTEGCFVSYVSDLDFLHNPPAVGFTEREVPPLTDGEYIGIGASKGVKLIEGPRGPGSTNAALFMDFKKAAFHVENQSIADKVSMILNKDPSEMIIDSRQLQLLKGVLKGIYVHCTYNPKAFKIHNLCKDNADTLRVDTDNGRITVREYFKIKYNITLKYPKLPLIVEKRQRGENYYPMELVIVCENQRVRQTQQSAAQVQAMIRACAVLPADRKCETDTMAKTVHLDGRTTNPWPDEFDVNVTNNLTPNDRILPAPQIEYGHEASVPIKPEKPSWIASKNFYLYPARCEKWCCVALVINNERSFNEGAMRNYVSAFIRQCRQHGMQISDPIKQYYVRDAKENNVESCVKKAKQIGAEFIHFVRSDGLSLHERMKLVEATEQIVTQDVKTSTAMNALEKRQTLDNIVNKTNLKLGGINFGFRLESERAQKCIMDPGRLIIGVDVVHPPKSKNKENPVPSVVGYSSNCKKHPLDFVGGYRYAIAEMEEITDFAIRNLIVESLEKFADNRTNLPNHIIVFRDGISEGQYPYVISTEVEQVKNACQKAGGNEYCPHITFVVATKMHNLGHLKKNVPQNERAPGQNVTPGTVEDQHAGTVKTPRYAKLFDTAKMVNDEIRAIIYALAYNHQIVNKSTSLPAPIIIASKMASRGRNNYVAQFGDSSDSSEGGGNRSRSLEELNAYLGYADKPLSNCLFNA